MYEVGRTSSCLRQVFWFLNEYILQTSILSTGLPPSLPCIVLNPKTQHQNRNTKLSLCVYVCVGGGNTWALQQSIILKGHDWKGLEGRSSRVESPRHRRPGLFKVDWGFKCCVQIYMTHERLRIHWAGLWTVSSAALRGHLSWVDLECAMVCRFRTRPHDILSSCVCVWWSFSKTPMEHQCTSTLQVYSTAK